VRIIRHVPLGTLLATNNQPKYTGVTDHISSKRERRKEEEKREEKRKQSGSVNTQPKKKQI
jgi:hypothetical protein